MTALTRPAARALTLTVVASALAALPSGSSGATARPDLAVASVTAPASVVRGATVRLRDVTTNKSSARAARSTTRYYLSTDKAFSRTDRLLGGHDVAALAPRTKRAGAVTVRVPATTAVRSYWVLACADARKRVRESREGNNCRAAGQQLRVTAPKPPPTGPTFPMPADPLAPVESHLQTAQAVTATAYPHEPTTIVATAVDGTTYTLTVPAGALLSQQDITLTPVTSVDGLPLSGGLVAGVQIEPHGLMLFAPAELAIRADDAGPIGQQVPLLFHEDGEDLHRYPVALPEPGDDADTIRMTLTHFSTPGVGLGSLTDMNAVDAAVPARLIAQAEALMAEASRRAREADASGQEPPPADWAEDVVTIMNAYFDQVVTPHLRDAVSSPALVPMAIAEAIAWSRNSQLMGDTTNPRHQDVVEWVARLLEVYLDWQWDKCTQQHELKAVRELVRVSRIAANMSLPIAEEAFDKGLQCGTFEVRLLSTVTESRSWAGTQQTGNMEARWELEGTVTSRLLEQSSGPLDYTGFTYAGTNTIHGGESDCTSYQSAAGTTPGRFRAGAAPVVPDLNVDEDENPSDTPDPDVNVALGLLGGQQPKETYHYTSCSGEESTMQDTRWASHFGMLRYSTSFTASHGEQDGALIALRTYHDVSGDGAVQGTTRVEVRHTPLAP